MPIVKWKWKLIVSKSVEIIPAHKNLFSMIELSHISIINAIRNLNTFSIL